MTTTQQDTDALEEAAALIEEIDSNQIRMRELVASGEVTLEVLTSEVIETQMSLMGDLARTVVDTLIDLKSELDQEVKPALQEMDDRLAELDEHSDDSQLTPEDARLFMGLLQWMRTALDEGIERANAAGDAAGVEAANVIRTDVETAIARVAEITMVEDEPKSATANGQLSVQAQAEPAVEESN